MLSFAARNQLLEVVAPAPTPVTIGDVVAIMTRIDHTLPNDDGLKWFNRLYRMVTEEIDADCRRQKWRSPAWLVHLDVEFAKLYFDAIRSWTAGDGKTPRAWARMFERRFDRGISKVQYGLAGINAHINRDLGVAVLRACARTGCRARWRSAEHLDYIRINQILDEVEVHAMQAMATGVIRRVSRAIQPLDRIAAMATIGRARDVAWISAMVMQRMKWSQIETLDVIAASVARGLLVPTEFGRLAIS